MSVKLFKILHLHGGPKDTAKWHTYALADNEEQVCDRIAKDNFIVWSDFDCDPDSEYYEGPWEVHDDSYNVTDTFSNYRDYLLHVGGRIHDDSYIEGAYGDAYYGVNASGWDKNPQEVPIPVAQILLDLGLVEDWREPSNRSD